MIHPRYDDAFRALTSEELTCCIQGLRATRPDLPDLENGDSLLTYCRDSHISQAEVVMGMARMHTPEAIAAVERIIMKPIDRRTASEVQRERDSLRPRAYVAPVSAREATTDLRIIRVLAEKCPKRPGTKSYDLWALYQDGMTVAQYLGSGGTRAALAWDQERAFIRLDDADATPAEAEVESGQDTQDTEAVAAAA